jgi:hypothetical protein
LFILLILVAVLVLLAGWVLAGQIIDRGMHRWLVPYVRTRGRRRAPRDGDDFHVLICIADHFEPKGGDASPKLAQSRVDRWVREYPRLFAGFQDSDGRPPRHTFFYPQEEYEPAYLDALADLCRAGYGEVEIHLHHDRDTAAGLRHKLLQFKKTLAERHGLLARDKNGALAYGFIHGNWALCNSRSDHRSCGVNNEIEVLRETGCYADFTYPSAPHQTQPPKINSIYYACDQPGKPCSHHRGTDVGAGPVPESGLLLIQGPLVLNWGRRKWGLLPGLENSCLQGTQPPTVERLANWLLARIQVPSRPDWFFVKLHAHGAQEESQAVLLGEAMVRFHEDLARKARDNPRFHYHYVTAREMFNLVKAAESGWRGPVKDALDFELVWNGTYQPDVLARGFLNSVQCSAQSFQEGDPGFEAKITAGARNVGL